MRHLLCLALGLALVLAGRDAAAFQFFNAQEGGCRWTSAPNFVVDATATQAKGTALLADMNTVRTTWNGIATAQDMVGTMTSSAADFTDANYGTTWGKGARSGTTDGVQEVALDETGDILRLLGADPASVNGIGITRRVSSGGSCQITDAMLVLNGTRTNNLDTKVHEMGHVLGLAHSSVGQFNTANTSASTGTYGSPSSALLPVPGNSLPVMHPFSLSTSRLPLKADDIAGLSTLYPDGSAATSLGRITGTVTRCSDGKPAAGVNVRAVKTDDTRVQVSRYSAFDNNTTGRFEIAGLPPGSYSVVVEEMGHNGFTKSRMAIVSSVDQGFPFEFHGPTVADETGCAEDTRDAALPLAVTAGASQTADLKLNDGVRLALVVDDTGSMSNEIGSVVEVINRMIDELVASSTVFPKTAIVSFKDDVTRRIVSDDPAQLRTVVNSLVASGGGDCPESSNAAVIDAARMLARGGKALLFTDADSRADGPSSASVLEYLRSRGMSLSVLLSATCTESFASGAPRGGTGRRGTLHAPRQGQQVGEIVAAAPAAGALRVAARGGAAPAQADEYGVPPVLGVVDALSAYSAMAAPSGGVLVITPRPTGGDERTAYVNAGLNMALGSVTSTVVTALPNSGARGAVMDIELSGARTNWTGASTVRFVGTGITVSSVRVLGANRIRMTATVPASQPLGFFDVEVSTPLGGGQVEKSTAIGGFQVTTPATGGEITSVTPASGSRGQTLDLVVRGLGTSFTDTSNVRFLRQGATYADLTVNSRTRVSATEMRLNVTLGDTALASPLDLAIDGVQTVRAFTVVEPAPAIAIVSATEPPRGSAGSTSLTVTITGSDTRFSGGSEVSFGTGVTVKSVTAESATRLRVSLDVAADAPLGYRDVSVSTDDETAVGLSSFQVTEAVAPPPPPPPEPEPEPDNGGGSSGGGAVGSPLWLLALGAAAAALARRRRA